MKERGFSYQSIRGLTSNHLDTKILAEQKELSPELKDVKAKSYMAQAYFDKSIEKFGMNYLSARGIEEETYVSYRGTHLKSGDQAVFALYQDLDWKGEGTMSSTITYQFKMNQEGGIESEKFFQKGLSRGVSILKDVGVPIDKVIVTESPIDALSHKQMNGEDEHTMYVATCGSLTETVKKELGTLLTGARDSGREVVLAFDNDKGGQQMQRKVADMATNLGTQFTTVHPNLQKDWNEALLVRRAAKTGIQNLRKMQQSLARTSEGDRYGPRR